MRAPTIHLDAITTAFATFLAVCVLMTWFRPGLVSSPRARSLVRDLGVSAGLCLVAPACLVTSAFVETFGESRVPIGLISALRGLSVPAVVLFVAASCLNLQKTRWLPGWAAPTGAGRFAIDVVVTAALFLGLHAIIGLAQPWTLVSETHTAIFCLLFVETGWMWFARWEWLSRPRSSDPAVTLGISAVWAAVGACWATRFSLL